MGILGSMVKTAMIKSVIRTTGSVVVETADSLSEIKEKSGLLYLKVPKSAEDYLGDDYENVEKDLSSCGFTNISLREKSDLRNGLLFKNKSIGKVSDISISGNNAFKRKMKFPSNAHIVIVYHTLQQ